MPLRWHGCKDLLIIVFILLGFTISPFLTFILQEEHVYMPVFSYRLIFSEYFLELHYWKPVDEVV
jgi:hypothetical protein